MENEKDIETNNEEETSEKKGFLRRKWDEITPEGIGAAVGGGASGWLVSRFGWFGALLDESLGVSRKLGNISTRTVARVKKNKLNKEENRTVSSEENQDAVEPHVNPVPKIDEQKYDYYRLMQLMASSDRNDKDDDNKEGKKSSRTGAILRGMALSSFIRKKDNETLNSTQEVKPQLPPQIQSKTSKINELKLPNLLNATPPNIQSSLGKPLIIPKSEVLKSNELQVENLTKSSVPSTLVNFQSLMKKSSLPPSPSIESASLTQSNIPIPKLTSFTITDQQSKTAEKVGPSLLSKESNISIPSEKSELIKPISINVQIPQMDSSSPVDQLNSGKKISNLVSINELGFENTTLALSNISSILDENFRESNKTLKDIEGLLMGMGGGGLLGSRRGRRGRAGARGGRLGRFKEGIRNKTGRLRGGKFGRLAKFGLAGAGLAGGTALALGAGESPTSIVEEIATEEITDKSLTKGTEAVAKKTTTKGTQEIVQKGTQKGTSKLTQRALTRGTSTALKASGVGAIGGILLDMSTGASDEEQIKENLGLKKDEKIKGRHRISAGVGETIGGTLDLGASLLNMTGLDIGETNYAKSVTQSVANVTDMASEIPVLGDGLNAVWGVGGSALNVVGDGVNSLVGGLIKTGSNVYGDLEQAGSSLMEGDILGSISSMGSSLLSAAGGLVTAITGTVGSMAGTFAEEVGLNKAWDWVTGKDDKKKQIKTNQLATSAVGVETGVSGGSQIVATRPPLPDYRQMMQVKEQKQKQLEKKAQSSSRNSYLNNTTNKNVNNNSKQTNNNTVISTNTSSVQINDPSIGFVNGGIL